MRRLATILGILLAGCAVPPAEEWLARAERAVEEADGLHVRARRTELQPDGTRRETEAHLHLARTHQKLLVDDAFLLHDGERIGRFMWIKGERFERRTAPARVYEHLVAAWIRAGVDAPSMIHPVWFCREAGVPRVFRLDEAAVAERRGNEQEVRYVLASPGRIPEAHRVWLDLQTGFPVRREAAGFSEVYDIETWRPAARMKVSDDWTDSTSGRPR